MAKRKRKSTTAPKAKRSPAGRMLAPVNAVPMLGYLCDLTTGRLFDPVTRKPIPEEPPEPPPTAEEIAARRERVRQRQARDEARRAAHRARLARRPVEMQRAGYALPADVAAFLHRLRDEPTFYSGEEQISTTQAMELIEAAYMDGCREGFIEGFLYGEDKARPGALKNRERLRQQNLDKLARLGIEDRNAEIVAEFNRLEHDRPGAEDRYQRIADEAKAGKPGRESWPTTSRQIGDIVRKAKKRRR
jgi:hypothetical protein